MTKWLPLLVLIIILTACAGGQPVPAAPAAVDPQAMTIFFNGDILTMLDDQPRVEALALRAEKILAIGSEEEILALQEPGAALIDLGGRALMPGFVDAHTHILNDARSQGRSLDQAQYMALRNGITTLGDLYADEPFVREMQDFASRGGLRVRTSLYMVADDNCGRALGDWYKKYPASDTPGEMLRIAGVKIFTDGGSCGGVALSFELEKGAGQGDLWLTQEQLNGMVSEAQAGGYQVAIHAIGDRAVAQAQEALALALDGGPNTHRHRMEHLSVLRPEMVARFGELGIVPVLNGQYPACTPFGPKIPEGYREWEWPWRDLRDANPGLPIAWHSDYPFLSVNPFVHLYGFVTRTDVFQTYTCAADNWLLDDTLSVEESLSIMTVQSAYALFREDEVGSLLPGNYADLIVVSANPLSVPAQELKSLSVEATMVGGRFEYCDPRLAELCPGYQQRAPLVLPDLRPPVAVRWLVLLLIPLLPLVVGLVGMRSLAGDHPMAAIPLTAISAIAGGALWAWEWAIRLPFDNSMESEIWTLTGAGVLLATALIGLGRITRPGRAGKVGLAIAWIGLVSLMLGAVLTSWFVIEEVWMLIFLGLIVNGIGLIVYGLVNFIAKRRSLIETLPLLMGLLGIVFPLVYSMMGNDQSQTPSIIVGWVLGLGWILMGVLILIANRERRL